MRSNPLHLRWRALAVATLAVLLAAPAVAAPKKGRAPVVVDGAAVYRGTCGHCHNARAIEELDPARWEIALTHMRVRGNLPARDIRALKDWINPPQETAQDRWATAAREAFPDVPLLADRCTRCHDPSRIQNAVAAGHDGSWWVQTLQRMRSYGAKLNPREQRKVVDAMATPSSQP